MKTEQEEREHCEAVVVEWRNSPELRSLAELFRRERAAAREEALEEASGQCDEDVPQLVDDLLKARAEVAVLREKLAEGPEERIRKLVAESSQWAGRCAGAERHVDDLSRRLSEMAKLARREHDYWCDVEETGDAGVPCDCSADEHNAKVESALAACRKEGK